MKKASVFVWNDTCVLAGYLLEIEKGTHYEFHYEDGYEGQPVSLTMPLLQKVYHFDHFPIFFEGFLPEGFMLDALLKKTKIESDDLFEQLMRVGGELVGNVTIERAM